jgi:formate-dependent nitrite reductase membrane component NrfD
VQVRKPEKETRAKLYYIEADEASLVPTRADADGRGMWSRGNFVGTDGEAGRLSLPTVTPSAPRRAYDVRRRAPTWGWEVAAYTWTKSIATGSFLAVLAARLLAGSAIADSLAVALGIVALLFLAITAALLVADLKQPRRFLYVLLRPQWRSWLVRGAYILTAYGAVLTAWLIAHLLSAVRTAEVLLWPGTVLAVFAAIYTALLFAQAKGRDFWQNPLLSVHLLAHALVAGGAMWLLIDAVGGGAVPTFPRLFTAGALILSLVTLIAELLTTAPTTDARLALDWIVGRPMGRWFWGGGIVVGHVVPLALLATGFAVTTMVSAVSALAGLYVIERLWVDAPQQVPLS